VHDVRKYSDKYLYLGADTFRCAWRGEAACEL